jgi:large subunit GTPase 1
MNKSDFLSEDLRQRWATYFAGSGTEVIFFSALRELHRQQRLPDPTAVSGQDASKQSGVDGAPVLLPHGDLSRDDADVLNVSRLLEELRLRLPATAEDGSIGTIGFVGYPNVGKSSVINAIFGAKKVSMGRVPGKTKHLQTLDLQQGITLCDCPGLVFPSVVATKSHLVINGTIPIEELRDHIPPVRLIVSKMGLEQAMEKYGLSASDLQEGIELREDGIGRAEDPARALLSGLATARKRFLRGKNPDETWAAKKVLLDFFMGALLYCEPPPSDSPVLPSQPAAPVPQQNAGYPSMPSSAPVPQASAVADNGDESDFDDLDDFLNAGSDDKQNSKRKTKQNQKQQSRNKAALG